MEVTYKLKMFLFCIVPCHTSRREKSQIEEKMIDTNANCTHTHSAVTCRFFARIITRPKRGCKLEIS